MKLGKVEKYSLFYTLLKAYGKFVHDFFFYKKVTYIGVKNIPDNSPVLIAPNHQNALMDALAIIYAQKGQPVFLARSDIFKNPTVAKMLFKIKILPVYRIRDGKDKMHLNDLIYNKTIEVLENNMKVVIFPEAQHIDKKHVRQLKKGIQRIAFMLEEKNEFKAGVKIIPTGIYYSNYWNFQSKLIVKFGEPINLEPYFEDYKKDPAKTLIKFSEILHKKITEQAIHIKDLNFHDEYDFLTEVLDKKQLKELSLKYNPENKLKADKKTVQELDKIKEEDQSEFNNLTEAVRNYSEKLKSLKLKDWVVERSNSNNFIWLKILILISSLPIFLYGLLNNIIVYLLPRLITKKLKDRQFESSIAYGFSIFLFPFVYLIQFALVWIFVKIWYVALIYLISVPFLGLLSFMIHRLFVKTFAQIRFLRIRKRKEGKELIDLREKIIEMF